MTSATDVAKFMVEELERSGFYLYQETVVHQIDMQFGSGFTWINANGNAAINKDVLAEFNKLTPEIVWERGSRLWRRREAYDKSGRLQ